MGSAAPEIEGLNGLTFWVCLNRSGHPYVHGRGTGKPRTACQRLEAVVVLEGCAG